MTEAYLSMGKEQKEGKAQCTNTTMTSTTTDEFTINLSYNLTHIRGIQGQVLFKLYSISCIYTSVYETLSVIGILLKKKYVNVLLFCL